MILLLFKCERNNKIKIILKFCPFLKIFPGLHSHHFKNRCVRPGIIYKISNELTLTFSHIYVSCLYRRQLCTEDRKIKLVLEIILSSTIELV